MTKPALSAVLHHLRSVAEKTNEARLTDRQLLENYLVDRDESAFAALVRRHGRLVLSACRRVLTDEADVEDAFQATFLVLLRRARSVRWQESIGNWLFGVAHRIAVQARANALRRRCRDSGASRERKRPEEPTDLSWREALGLLHEELNRLPDKYRLPLLLCYLESKTREEAAHTLRCSAGAIKGRLERGRLLLRDRLIRRGVALSGALLAALVDAPPARSVAPDLVQATLNAAQTGAYRSSVAVLIKAAAPALWTGKTRLAVGALLMVSLLVVGGGSAPAPPRAAPEPPVAGQAPRRQAPRAPEQAIDKDAVVYKGRVLGPDDKPLAGAKVYYYFLAYQEEAIPVRATTDAQGRFAFTLTPKDIPLSADAERADPRKSGHIIVKADGFTFAWHHVLKQQKEWTFHVAADDVPLTGRIIDLQGKPLAGLRVTAWSVAAPETGDLSPFVKALQSRETFYTALRTHVSNVLQNPYYWRPRTPLLPATTTDANGRFRLHGFAKEQLVELRIEGPAIETQNIFIMTRPAPREGGELLSAPKIKDPMFGPGEPFFVLANGFDYPVPPGLTVAGTVRDAGTQRPLAGAIVESYTLAGTMVSQNPIYHTVADEQGRYRFNGLPRGKGNRIRIRPPADQPYVPAVMEVPATKLFTEAKVDGNLMRGVWVDVKATDKATGRPVPGHVSYFVLPEKSSPERPFEQPFADSYNNFMAVRNDGTFRFVAVPRRAILAFRGNREKYPIAPEAATIHFPFGLSASNFQAFAEINPKPGDGPVKVNFVLDAGRIVKGKILDPDGRPLSGVLAAGLRHDWYVEPDMPLKTAEFTALGVSPDRSRLLCFVHEEKKLAGSIIVRGDESQPIAVKLEPWGTVSGRLLDAQGKPIPNATLWFTEIPVHKPGQPRSLDTGLHVVQHFGGRPSPDPHTDEQGRFRADHLVPGLKYNLALMDANGATRFEEIKWPGLVFSNLILKPGETKELGDVKLQPLPKREAAGTVTIQGRVLAPDGQPAAGARVFVDPQSPDEKPIASATTDKDGRFSLSIPRSRLIDAQTKFPLRQVRILATAKGWGLDWLEVPLDNAGKEATLRLVKDDVPIEGRILSLEGKPLAGIKVRIQALEAFPRNDLDRALDAKRKGNQISESTEVRFLWYRHYLPAPSLMATTGADGRFRLEGVGRERIVTLNLEGPGIHYHSFNVMTRRADAVRGPYKNDILRGPTFEYTVKPARLVRGNVREKGTGKLLAGIHIRGLGFSEYVTAEAVTDEQGHYELPGCPKESRYGVVASPNPEAAYFGASIYVPDTPGMEPLTIDLELMRGIPCEGKVLDEAGQAVPGEVRYCPLFPNPNVPDDRGVGRVHVEAGSRAAVQADGTFRCVVLPDCGCLAFRAKDAKHYRQACVDPGAIKSIGDRDYLNIQGSLASGGLLDQEEYQAIRLLKPTKETKKISEILRVVAAPPVLGTMVDAEGKPLTEVRVRGLEHGRGWKLLPSEKFSVHGVNPLRPRRLYFVHDARRLIGSVEIKGTETEPLTVRLQPWAAVRGRLLDKEGNPLRNINLHGSEFVVEEGHTDDQGRFRLDGLVPGLPYNLHFSKPGTAVSAMLRKGIVGKPGEAHDLGEMRVQPPRAE